MSESVKDGRELPDALQGLQPEKGCSVMTDSATDAAPKRGFIEWLFRWSTLASFSFIVAVIMIVAWIFTAMLWISVLKGGADPSVTFSSVLRGNIFLIAVSIGLTSYVIVYSLYWSKKRKKAVHLAMPKWSRGAALIADTLSLAIWIDILATMIDLGQSFSPIFIFLLIIGFLMISIEFKDYGEAVTEEECKDVVFRALAMTSLSLAIILWLLSLIMA